jgi:hypothetical protein
MSSVLLQFECCSSYAKATSGILADCLVKIGDEIEQVDLGFIVHPAFCKNIQTVSYALTFATTGCACVLIWYKNWYVEQLSKRP